MALTISTGFVVDDAIVVIENITRYLEAGHATRSTAALKGAQEIGFTVLSISISLIAVFIPLLLMGGIVGRLFREFAVTLSVAIVVSMVVSLTTTPMMCAHLLKEHESHGRLYRASERAFNWIVGLYGRTLDVVLRHPFVTLLVLLATIGLNVYLFIRVPKGFFPQQDNGRMQRPDSSRPGHVVSGHGQDPAADGQHRGRRSGGRHRERVHRRRRRRRCVHLNQARMFISLKPLDERKVTADQIIARLRPKLARVPGATLYPAGRAGPARRRPAEQRAVSVHDARRQPAGPDHLRAPACSQQLKTIPVIADVNSDQQNHGLQSLVHYDRDTAARFGISPQLIDNTLYDAFGQRQVSTMYTSLNQYHVVMEAAPQFWQNPADPARHLRARAQRPAGSA